MPLQLVGKKIERITIVDDDANARQAYEFSVEDLGLEPLSKEGPLPQSIDSFLKQLLESSEALLCDYHLKTTVYANFDGDELVGRCYKKGFPAVLCTAYTDFDVTLMRSRRRFIPVLLKPDEVEPDAIARGLENCLNEFNNEFLPSRKPWRTLVRVEEVEEDSNQKYFYVVVPGWDTRKKIRLYFDDLPSTMHKVIKAGKRFHAQVNVGAEIDGDLYFDGWEAK